jgi:hypothetical protein
VEVRSKGEVKGKMERMAKDELLRHIMEAKVEWEATSSLLNPQEQDETRVAGDWTVKDIYAHLLWHEREMLNWLRAGRFGGSPLWSQQLDERNRAIWEESRDRLAVDVRQDARDVHEALVRTIETLTDEQLNDPAQWPGMPAEWTPWEILADNTYLHYRDHSADLKAHLNSAVT